MFRELRRADRSLPIDNANEFLKKENYGVLSVLGDDDYPYGIPVCYVYYDNFIYIHCFLDGHKVDAVRKHSKVCFTVFGETEVLPDEISTNYTSVVVFGTAEVLPMENETERQTALEVIGIKYCPGNQNLATYIKNSKAKTNIIKINIDQMTGKRRGPGKK